MAAAIRRSLIQDFNLSDCSITAPLLARAFVQDGVTCSCIDGLPPRGFVLQIYMLVLVRRPQERYQTLPPPFCSSPVYSTSLFSPPAHIARLLIATRPKVVTQSLLLQTLTTVVFKLSRKFILLLLFY